MKKLMLKIVSNEKKISIKEKIKEFINEERGEFGIKGIAATVATIVVIGLIVALLKDSFLEDIIDYFWTHIKNIVDTMVNG